MSSKQRTVHQCQYQNARGQRCHMLIDESHRSPQGTARPTLCAYHANRLKASVPAVEHEVLAADLLGEINDFSNARSVNSFLGNLVDAEEEAAKDAEIERIRPVLLGLHVQTQNKCARPVAPLRHLIR